VFLYRILNIIDNKEYAGITNSIARRWKEHKIELKGNRHHNAHLQSAWNLYGEQSFSFEVLGEFLALESLYKAEVEYIKIHNLTNQSCGYNLDMGGAGSFLHTKDAKNRISKSQEKAVVSMCLKTGDFKKYDRIQDVERDGLSPKSISNPCTDRALTHAGRVWMYFEDYIKNPNKLLEKKESRQNVKARPSRYRTVFGMNIKTKEAIEYVAIYHSVVDGFLHQSIYKCCTHPEVSKSHKGFVWSFDKHDLFNKMESVLKNKTHKVA